MRYGVSPTSVTMEVFYLRMLLHVTKGPRSFEDLRTVEGVLYPSYKAACFARGLIEDDSEWHEALKEAELFKSPEQMRQLFVVILTACFPLDPAKLLQDFCRKSTKRRN